MAAGGAWEEEEEEEERVGGAALDPASSTMGVSAEAPAAGLEPA